MCARAANTYTSRGKTYLRIFEYEKNKKLCFFIITFAFLFVFLKKKGGSLPRGMVNSSLHSNSQFCCKHVGFSYIFEKGTTKNTNNNNIARDTLPREDAVHLFSFVLFFSSSLFQSKESEL